MDYKAGFWETQGIDLNLTIHSSDQKNTVFARRNYTRYPN